MAFAVTFSKTFAGGIRRWHSQAAFAGGIRRRHSQVAFAGGIRRWHSQVAFAGGIRRWHFLKDLQQWVNSFRTKGIVAPTNLATLWHVMDVTKRPPHPMQ